MKKDQKSTLHKILNLITAYNQYVLSSVDYVSTILVDSTSGRLQSIIGTCLSHHKQKANTATNLLKSATHYLKHDYSNHTERNDDTICFNGLDYGSRKCTSDGTTIQNNSDCSACKFPFKMIQILEGYVQSEI